jgi:hypothetical protein
VSFAWPAKYLTADSIGLPWINHGFKFHECPELPVCRPRETSVGIAIANRNRQSGLDLSCWGKNRRPNVLELA